MVKTKQTSLLRGNPSRLIGSYIRSWERPGDLPRVIEILCLFTEEITFLHTEQKQRTFSQTTKLNVF